VGDLNPADTVEKVELLAKRLIAFLGLDVNSEVFLAWCAQDFLEIVVYRIPSTLVWHKFDRVNF
jgi:hypothetical protein